jgi:hypothetical protein
VRSRPLLEGAAGLAAVRRRAAGPARAAEQIAPTQQLLALFREPESGKLVIDAFRWGLIPSWAKDPKIGNKTFNARAETLAEKPSFRDAFRKRRCAILVDGFYEWATVGKAKVPHVVTVAGRKVLRARRPVGRVGVARRRDRPELHRRHDHRERRGEGAPRADARDPRRRGAGAVARSGGERRAAERVLTPFGGALELAAAQL